MKNVCILGSTGSIGVQSLEVCKALGYKVTGLSAQTSWEQLALQAEEFSPYAICIGEESLLPALQQRLSHMDIEILAGRDGLCKLAAQKECDILLNAVVGIAGLEPTIAGIKSGKDIALANKEALVTGGSIVINTAKQFNVKILPVDSEHSAIFQSLQGNEPSEVKSILLTASGGPFYGKTAAELEAVTIKEALAHPKWSMGAKISIDSATLMNKGLELIEACVLFAKEPSEVQIVVHPESIVHSLVEYQDNAVIAQLGVPDMKLPIQYALTYPNRMKCQTGRLELSKLKSLTFGEADEETFLCLKACKEAIKLKGVYPTIVNGANEEAVALFLMGKIGFMDIGRIVYGSLQLKYQPLEIGLDEIFTADLLAREYVRSIYSKFSQVN